jgi:hypothetical protein
MTLTPVRKLTGPLPIGTNIRQGEGPNKYPPPMKRCLLLLISLLAMDATAQTLKTRWAANVTPENVHREYPRPQMVRKDWVNLNGLWDIELRHPNSPADRGKILVPFCAESQLSGFHRRVEPEDVLHYSRTFARPEGARVLLHFGAVDWIAKVSVNGKTVGEHKGGYDPFSFDITSSLTNSGTQTLEVDVTDPTDHGAQPRGKQTLNPRGIMYTPCSGIWQTVWLEVVPETYIDHLTIEALPQTAQVTIQTAIDGPADGVKCRTETIVGGKVVAKSEGDAGHVSVMKIRDAINWTPDHPYLYDLRITLLDKNGGVLDQVTSYYGFRETTLIKDEHGQPRIALNGKPIFLIGPLDQGFWPDGIYTPPSDEALKYDIELTKRLGFNMIRKHVKVESARFYYWCDKLGLCVLQDMPSGDKSIGPSDPDIERTKESADDFRAELKAMVDNFRNYPCICTWVLYNEGWGQWNTAEMTKWLKDYDPNQLVDSNTGWSDRGVGDYNDIHVYPGPASPPPDPNRAIFLGEFGGLGLPVPGHMWKETGWGYQSFKTKEELTDKFVELMENLRFLQAKGLSGAVYTQTTDVETELNGLMTYDRAMLKMDEAKVHKAITDLFLPPPTIHQVVPTAEESANAWRYQSEGVMSDGKWAETQFDDSGWQQGPGGFGTPETPGSVVRTSWKSKDIYLRRKIHLDRDFKAGELWLRLSHDDDVEVFLDGRSIYKAPGWTTSYRNVHLPQALAKGDHVLAIHCHQNQGGQFVDAGLIRIE